MANIPEGAETMSMRGFGLDRPECVLATGSGDLFVSDRHHGVTRLSADGRQFHLGRRRGEGEAPILANGIALKADATFLIANIADTGGIYGLDPSGDYTAVLSEIGGKTCPPVNFVTVDDLGRIWVSISSTLSPRHLAYRRDVKNGLVGVIDASGARIVVEGLHYANEIWPELENGYLYVSETFGQRVTRFRIDESLAVGPAETVARLPRGSFIDGIALDEEGALWGACIVSNEIVRIYPDGAVETVVSERDEGWVETVEAALDAKEMTRRHFDSAPTKTLRNVSSLAFGGVDRKQIFCGSLLGDRLISLDVAAAGRRPLHWDVCVPLWGEEMQTEDPVHA